jgi:membrane-bound lytic murein transglycosylase B
MIQALAKARLYGLVMLTLWSPTALAEGFLTDPRAEQLILDLQQSGLDADQIRQWLAQGEFLESTRTSMAAPRERTATWAEYRPLFVNDLSIERGREFMAEHAEAFARVESELGIDPRVVAAIIGVETRYGRFVGTHSVMNALGTTAFSDSPRSDYFLRELNAFFRLAANEGIDPLSLQGSFAGASGIPQFMPSSFLAYAIDFNGDGQRDIWHNMEDAIGSVANYLAAHHWQPGAPVAIPARLQSRSAAEWVDHTRRRPHTAFSEVAAAGWLPAQDIDPDEAVSLFRLEGEQGEEFWLGLQNFYVITRYNHSILYAMAVYHLSQQL